MRKYPPAIVRQKMIAYCDKAEHCQWDVRNKLLQWHIPSQERESLISELISTGMLNESRYAAAFVHDKSTFNQWGVNKISVQLKAKGISERNILDAVKELDQSETIKTVRHLIQRKEPQFKGLQLYQKKYKLTRFLLAKGFAMNLIAGTLDDYFS